MAKHECIKPVCSNSYKDNEVDPYYCPSCREANKELVKKIDSLVASRPKLDRTSPLQEYEASVKIKRGGAMGVHVKL